MTSKRNALKQPQNFSFKKFYCKKKRDSENSIGTSISVSFNNVYMHELAVAHWFLLYFYNYLKLTRR